MMPNMDLATFSLWRTKVAWVVDESEMAVVVAVEMAAVVVVATAVETVVVMVVEMAAEMAAAAAVADPKYHTSRNIQVAFI